MQNIRLNNQLILRIEDDRAGLRMIIADAEGAEIVCHKITKAKLKTFLNADQAHLFKGRLQLCKTGGDISVQVKGETVSVVGASDIAQ